MDFEEGWSHQEGVGWIGLRLCVCDLSLGFLLYQKVVRGLQTDHSVNVNCRDTVFSMHDNGCIYATQFSSDLKQTQSTAVLESLETLLAGFCLV